MENLAVARLFAKSLDEEDYVVTASMLAPACRYEIDDEVHVGPDAIIGSYRKHGNWAARNLDKVSYDSDVRTDRTGDVVLELVDYLEHTGLSHTYRCEQWLSIGNDGLIASIRHVDIRGQRDSLLEYFREVGLA